MFSAVAFAVMVIAVASVTAQIDSDNDLTVAQIIAARGYPVEEHIIPTADGYLLGFQRIPHGLKQNATNNRVVLLWHGLLDSSFCFVSNYFPSQVRVWCEEGIIFLFSEFYTVFDFARRVSSCSIVGRKSLTDSKSLPSNSGAGVHSRGCRVRRLDGQLARQRHEPRAQDALSDRPRVLGAYMYTTTIKKNQTNKPKKYHGSKIPNYNNHTFVPAGMLFSFCLFHGI